MTITRVNETDYSVVTSTVLTDGSFRSDDCMRLHGADLVSHQAQGDIRLGGLLRVKLGAISLNRVQVLSIGESGKF